MFYILNHCFPNWGPRGSAVSFGSKSIVRILWDTERIKNSPLHVCATNTFVRWPSTEVCELLLSTTSYPSIIILENIHYFKLMLKYGSGNFNCRYNVSPIHLHTFSGVGNFTREGWSACAPTAYKGTRDYRKFKKHCSKLFSCWGTISKQWNILFWLTINTAPTARELFAHTVHLAFAVWSSMLHRSVINCVHNCEPQKSTCQRFLRYHLSSN
jgi:hypothetical protein